MSQRRYRILHVIDSLALGGAQVVLLNLLQNVDRDRFAPEVACLHGRGVFWDAIQSVGFPLASLSFHHLFPSYLPALAALMAAKRYDVVHSHLLASNVIAKPLAALLRVPVRINHDHCNDKSSDPRPWAAPADAWANRFSTHVIAVSDSTRAFVEEKEGVPAARASTIHNGIDCARFQPRAGARSESRRKFGLAENAFIVGGIGRLTYQKHFALFIETASAILARHPNVQFAIAGTGEEEAALRDQARRAGIDDKVRFLGFVSDMPSLYPALDLLLLTSRFEGLPITILEAMASGIPIVSSRLDGIAEILSDGKDAALVGSQTSEAFGAEIEKLLSSPALRQDFASAALQKVRTFYSAQRMTREVEAVYLRYLEPASP